MCVYTHISIYINISPPSRASLPPGQGSNLDVACVASQWSNRWMDEEVLVHIYDGILLSHRKEQMWISWTAVDEPRAIIQSLWFLITCYCESCSLLGLEVTDNLQLERAGGLIKTRTARTSLAAQWLVICAPNVEGGGAQVWSLVRELGSCMLHDIAKKEMFFKKSTDCWAPPHPPHSVGLGEAQESAFTQTGVYTMEKRQGPTVRHSRNYNL